MGRLIVILGDQLSPRISSLRDADRSSDVILMMEVQREATYVRHHRKKIAFVFSAMRHFADELRQDGWNVDYRRLDLAWPDAASPESSFTFELERAAALHQPGAIVLTEPGEWRVRQEFEQWACRTGTPLELRDDDRFLCSTADFARWAGGRAQMRMEHFYREMRRRTGLLMDGGEPAGGRWNFDHDNRRAAPSALRFPAPLRFEPDAQTRQVLDLVDARFPRHFGDLHPFGFAVTRSQAQQALAHFIETALPSFGHYQDAMLEGERFLYHSLLSVYLNAGLLDPLEVCRRVEAAYRSGQAPLNAAEGYIRQIIGWREYVRGIYWLRMPAYASGNYFGHVRPVPDFYWTGKTDMACLRASIVQTIEEAYAHHIQRLMLTGNFALLAGVSPQALHEWYLMVYADAYEWVELPNTLGMSQFADGGLLASKPYISSGAYIHRMSNHCKGCRYDVKDAVGPRACPFNALYWDFLARHRERLGANPRLSPAYRTWDAMEEGRRKALRAKAGTLLAQLDEERGDSP